MHIIIIKALTIAKAIAMIFTKSFRFTCCIIFIRYWGNIRNGQTYCGKGRKMKINVSGMPYKCYINLKPCYREA